MGFEKKKRQLNSNPIHFRTQKVDQKKGLLEGVCVIEVGEAKGHYVSVEQEFLQGVVRLGNQQKKGVKIRFGHPNWMQTNYGTYAGRSSNYRIDGDRVIADFQLDEVARNSKNGDMYTYTLEMAEKNPDMFGVSIVFTPGIPYQYQDGERVDYIIENEKGDWGYNEKWDWSLEIFETIKELSANDFVDQPAATSALFSQDERRDFYKELNLKNKNQSTIMAEDKNTEISAEEKKEFSRYQKLKAFFKGEKETTDPATEVKPEKSFAQIEADLEKKFEARFKEQDDKNKALSDELETSKAAVIELQGKQLGIPTPTRNGSEQETAPTVNTEPAKVGSEAWAEGHRITVDTDPSTLGDSDKLYHAHLVNQAKLKKKSEAAKS